MKTNKTDIKKFDLAFTNATIKSAEIKGEDFILSLRMAFPAFKNSFPKDNRLKIVFNNFGRIVISLYDFPGDFWKVRKIENDELKTTIENLRFIPFYDKEFINLNDSFINDFGESFNEWGEDLSLDHVQNNDWSIMNTIDLIAETDGLREEQINLRIWFDEFRVSDYVGNHILLNDFYASASNVNSKE